MITGSGAIAYDIDASDGIASAWPGMGLTPRARVLLVLLPALMGVAGAATAVAQAVTPPIGPIASPPAGQQEGGVPPPVTNDPTAVELNATMAFLIVLALLGLLAYVLWRLFDYLRESRDDYYRTVREFARKGVFFNPVLVATTSPAFGRLEGVEENAGPATFALTGPGVMTTGQQAVFTALLNDANDPDAEWRVEPPAGLDDAGATLTGGGASVTVEAARQGGFTLVASHPGTPVLSVRTQVTVVDPPPAGEALPNLPFIGQGYGSLVGAVVLIAALVVLATTRAIDADVVGVILGALAGYLFGVGLNQGRT